MTDSTGPRFYNRTRQSASLPGALLRRGRVLALPLYGALRASDLAREGLDHSGSYRFADHVYRDEPSGHGVFGRWLDARLLALPAVRSFRSRFHAARDELSAFLLDRAGAPGRLDVLSAPCGIPRELVEGYRQFVASGAIARADLTFHGLDLDAEALREAADFARSGGLAPFVVHHGDVFDPASYPQAARFHHLHRPRGIPRRPPARRFAGAVLRSASSWRTVSHERHAPTRGVGLSAAPRRAPRALSDGLSTCRSSPGASRFPVLTSRSIVWGSRRSWSLVDERPAVPPWRPPGDPMVPPSPDRAVWCAMHRRPVPWGQVFRPTLRLLGFATDEAVGRASLWRRLSDWTERPVLDHTSAAASAVFRQEGGAAGRRASQSREVRGRIGGIEPDPG